MSGEEATLVPYTSQNPEEVVETPSEGNSLLIATLMIQE